MTDVVLCVAFCAHQRVATTGKRWDFVGKLSQAAAKAAMKGNKTVEVNIPICMHIVLCLSAHRIGA